MDAGSQPSVRVGRRVSRRGMRWASASAREPPRGRTVRHASFLTKISSSPSRRMTRTCVESSILLVTGIDLDARDIQKFMDSRWSFSGAATCRLHGPRLTRDVRAMAPSLAASSLRARAASPRLLPSRRRGRSLPASLGSPPPARASSVRVRHDPARFASRGGGADRRGGPRARLPRGARGVRARGRRRPPARRGGARRGVRAHAVIHPRGRRRRRRPLLGSHQAPRDETRRPGRRVRHQPRRRRTRAKARRRPSPPARR